MDSGDSKTKLKAVPEPSLRRLPIYYHLVQTMVGAGVTYVSAAGIAARLQLDATQVRKDLEATGIIGKPKVGYPAVDLIRRIQEFLGWNQTKKAVLVGAGSLGTALLRYEKFRQLGFELVAAFDEDPAKVGHAIGGTDVLPMDRLVEHCEGLQILLGVITTSPGSAQTVANALVAAGIRAIWNFAPTHVQVPPTVLLQNEDLYRSLASLSFRLDRMLASERVAFINGTETVPNSDDSSASVPEAV